MNVKSARSGLLLLAFTTTLLFSSFFLLFHRSSNISTSFHFLGYHRLQSYVLPTRWRSSHSDREEVAYATILTGTPGDGGDPNDPYLVALRILGYQLIHCPETRTQKDIPFLVLVTDKISEKWQKRLSADGAEVIKVDTVPMPSWIHPGVPRWKDVMTKLRAWQLTKYSKILLLDVDTILTGNMDGIFDVEAAQWLRSEINSVQSEGAGVRPRATVGHRRPVTKRFEESSRSKVPEDRYHPDYEAPMLPPPPEKYLMSTALAIKGSHTTPPEFPKDLRDERKHVNAGFMMLGPSQEMFEYYLAAIHTPNYFAAFFPEQDLLDRIHIQNDTFMPWQYIGFEWNTIYPTEKDLGLGEENNGTAYIKSAHTKWWDHDKLSRSFETWMLEWRWRMQGFYEKHDEQHKISDIFE